MGESKARNLLSARLSRNTGDDGDGGGGGDDGGDGGGQELTKLVRKNR